jgi:hypothetical protein
LLLVGPARPQLPDLAPLTQHGGTVGQLDHVLEIVGDQDDRVSFGLQLRDKV